MEWLISMIKHIREESFLFHFEIEIYLNFSVVIYSRTVIYGLNFFPTITFGHISYSRVPFFLLILFHILSFSWIKKYPQNLNNNKIKERYSSFCVGQLWVFAVSWNVVGTLGVTSPKNNCFLASRSCHLQIAIG